MQSAFREKRTSGGLSMSKKVGNFTMPPVVGAAAEPINNIQNKKEKTV
jgi:hypothetical protein